MDCAGSVTEAELFTNSGGAMPQGALPSLVINRRNRISPRRAILTKQPKIKGIKIKGLLQGPALLRFPSLWGEA
jgi:hypothetical protein